MISWIDLFRSLRDLPNSFAINKDIKAQRPSTPPIDDWKKLRIG